MRVSYTETRAQADQVIDVYVASDDRPGGCSGELWVCRAVEGTGRPELIKVWGIRSYAWNGRGQLLKQKDYRGPAIALSGAQRQALTLLFKQLGILNGQIP